MELRHAIDRPYPRSGPDELPRLLAVREPTERSLPVGSRSEGGVYRRPANRVNRQRLGHAWRLTSRNPGEPVNFRPFMRLL